MSEPTSDEIELGEVVGTFSFRGELRLHLHNPSSDLLREAKRVVLLSPSGERVETTLSTRPGAGGRVLGRVAGVTDEAGADALRGYRILIAKAALPPLGDDEFYVWQLVGCAVRIAEAVVGEVSGVQDAGPSQILEVAVPEGAPRFVPIRREFVLRIDTAGREIELAPGALDEDE